MLLLNPIVVWAQAWTFCSLIIPTIMHFRKTLGVTASFVRSLSFTIMVWIVLCSTVFLDKTKGFDAGISSLTVWFYSTKVYEVVTEDDIISRPLMHKIAHVGLAFQDIRLLKSIGEKEKRYTISLIFQKIIVHVAIVILSIVYLRSLQMSSTLLGSFVTYFGACLAGGLNLYASLEVLMGIINLGAFAIGYQLPPIMNNIWSSTTVKDFWLRWDTVVQDILKRKVHIPLKQNNVRGDIAGFATFLASGFLHMYPLIVAGLDRISILSMFSFFLIQAFCIKLEKDFGVNKLPKKIKQVWTFSCLVLPSFLFIIPVLKSLDLLV